MDPLWVCTQVLLNKLSWTPFESILNKLSWTPGVNESILVAIMVYLCIKKGFEKLFSCKWVTFAILTQVYSKCLLGSQEQNFPNFPAIHLTLFEFNPVAIMV